MDIEHLVTMVNEIGAFFDSEDKASAAAQVANHLRKFWDPRMRKQICEFAAADGHGLSDVARRAVALLP
jgi:formate dehydrogenase subunit delta